MLQTQCHASRLPPPWTPNLLACVPWVLLEAPHPIVGSTQGIQTPSSRAPSTARPPPEPTHSGSQKWAFSEASLRPRYFLNTEGSRGLCSAWMVNSHTKDSGPSSEAARSTQAVGSGGAVERTSQTLKCEGIRDVQLTEGRCGCPEKVVLSRY